MATDADGVAVVSAEAVVPGEHVLAGEPAGAHEYEERFLRELNYALQVSTASLAPYRPQQ